MNSRLEEAMRPTRYNDDAPKSTSQYTGIADQKPRSAIVGDDEPPAKLPYDPATAQQSHLQPPNQARPAAPAQKPEKRAWRMGKPVKVRETSEDDFSHLGLMDESEPGPPPVEYMEPDPFPLVYKNGNPNTEFDVTGDNND